MTTYKKILTIIIPTYNMERYLHKCLSSLLIGEHQELLDVLVINDGSKDSSLEIALDFQVKYPDTFRVIDKENGNYGSCINRGLQEAKGKYIKILDADDSYDTSALATLLDRLMHIDVDLIVTDYIIVNESGEQTSRHTRKNLEKEKVISGDEIFGKCRGDLIMMHEVTYRTENLLKTDYKQTEGIAFTDQEWILGPVATVSKAFYMDIPVYRYLVGRQGQTVDVKRTSELQVQGNETMFVQIDTFNKLGAVSSNVRCYLLALILQNLRYTYRNYLIVSYDILPISDLRVFDDRLKVANGDIYRMSGEVYVHSKYPLRFINVWRKSRGDIPFSIKFYRSIIFPILRKFHLG